MPTPLEYILTNKDPIEPDLCVVLMPFSETFNEIYESCIKPCVEKSNLRVLRADEIYSNSAIIDDILSLILRASIIVADVSGGNPNVLYELGISHSLSNKVVIITQDIGELPFDTSHIRTIHYKNSISGARPLADSLMKTIAELKDQPVVRSPMLGSPIGEAGYHQNIRVVHGADDCLRTVVEILEGVQAKYGNKIGVYRAMATEYTLEVFKNPSNEVLILLDKYRSLIRYIAQEGAMGVENWDYTIYGRVTSSALNEATFDFVTEVYFDDRQLPDTSEIGINKSIDVESFIVAGHYLQDNGEYVPDVGIMLFGDESGLRPSSGFVFYDRALLHLVVTKFWSSLKSNAVSKNGYWNFLKFGEQPEKISEIKTCIREFLI